MAVLSRIQRGVGTMTTATSTVTVSSYDPEKTIFCMTMLPSGVAPSSSAIRIRPTAATGSQTSFELDRASSSYNQAVRWEMWEFSSGVTVEHINVTAANMYTAITCASRTTTSSFILSSFTSTSGTGFYSGRQFFTLRYGSSTTIELEANFEDNTVFTDISLQSIEWTGSTVQLLDFTLTANTDTDTATVCNAVTLTNAIAIGSMHGTDMSPRTNDAVRYVHYFSDSTHLNVVRNTGTSHTANFKFFIINFGDSTVVAQYSGAIDADASTSVALSPSVDTANSTAFLNSTNMANLFSGTRTANTDADSPLPWMHSVTLASSTATLDRDSAQTAAGAYRLAVITFDAGAAATSMPPQASKSPLQPLTRPRIIPY